MTVTAQIVWFPGAPITLEVILLYLSLLLIAIGGYVLLMTSMKNDRYDRRRKFHRANPWERLENQNANKQPPETDKFKVLRIILIAVVSILTLFVLAILLGWINI